MKFTGAVLLNTNHPLQLVENIQVPKLEAGQVLVKVAYAGVCHSQLMEQCWILQLKQLAFAKELNWPSR
jgi:Zn-dependent alcohol dehydrogenase